MINFGSQCSKVIPISMRYNKIGMVLTTSDNKNISMEAIVLAGYFRVEGVSVDIAWGKSLKSQLNYFNKRKSNDENLIWFGEDDHKSFYYQDTHEYPQWMSEEFGTINFQKVKYPKTKEGVLSCIADQSLIELIM